MNDSRDQPVEQAVISLMSVSLPGLLHSVQLHESAHTPTVIVYVHMCEYVFIII